jgi:hydroxymethylglutaryl-CoA reductase
MVENAVGTFSLPFGVALNFRVNGKDVVVPLVVEEPSVIAAASGAALLARARGGFTAEADDGVMIGQIQLVDVADGLAAVERLWRAAAGTARRARCAHAGALPAGRGPARPRSALPPRTERGADGGRPRARRHGRRDGARTRSTRSSRACRRSSEEVGRGRACLRILSNLADRRLARASVTIPCDTLARGGLDGDAVAARVVQAWDLPPSIRIARRPTTRAS